MFIKYEVSLQFKNQFRPTFHVDWVPLPHFLGIQWSNNTNMDDYDKFSCSIPYERYRIQVRLLATGEHTSWHLKKCSSFLIAVNGVRFVILPRRNIKGNFSVVLKKEKKKKKRVSYIFSTKIFHTNGNSIAFFFLNKRNIFIL